MREIPTKTSGKALSGWLAPLLWLALLAWAIWLVLGWWRGTPPHRPAFPRPLSVVNLLAIPLLVFLRQGAGIPQPNIAAVKPPSSAAMPARGTAMASIGQPVLCTTNAFRCAPTT